MVVNSARSVQLKVLLVCTVSVGKPVGQLVESDRAAVGKTLVASKSCVTSVGEGVVQLKLSRVGEVLAVRKKCAAVVVQSVRKKCSGRVVQPVLTKGSSDRASSDR